jgi:hypothetical protein
MKKAMVPLIFFFLVSPAHGLNSLVRYEDIPRMKDLGISQEVIDFLTSHQTSSIGSQDVIQMKKSGMGDAAILSAVKSDLYRPESKPTEIEKAELVAQLKASGMSDEAVLQFLDTVKTTLRVDSSGDQVRQYNTDRSQIPTSGAEFPEINNYAYDPLYDRYLIYVQPRDMYRPKPHAAPSRR